MGWPFENLTRAPFALDCRPIPSSRTPALTSSSLYFAIAASAFSEGMTPASVSLLALIIIMNRMADLLLVTGFYSHVERLALGSTSRLSVRAW